MTTLTEKNIVITGASSGIGEACALAFAKAGANIILCARRADKIQSLSEKIRQEYAVRTHGIACDVRNASVVKQQFSDLPDPWKNIDIVINNAGLAAGLETIQDADIADWEAMIDTNVKGLLYVTRAILPRMIANNTGHIINIGSIAGHTVYPKGVVYCATKHAVNAVSRGLRMDLLGTNIRVTSVDPGAVETNFSVVRFKGDTARAKKVYEGFQPLSAQDIADSVLYCATRPPHVTISEMIIMPTAQADVAMIARQ